VRCAFFICPDLIYVSLCELWADNRPVFLSKYASRATADFPSASKVTYSGVLLHHDGQLRTAANSVVLKIIFGIIIVSFILTGVSGYLIGGGNNYAAKVNGQEIGRGSLKMPLPANVTVCSSSLATSSLNWRRTKTT
jgi:hypothetical protein